MRGYFFGKFPVSPDGRKGEAFGNHRLIHMVAHILLRGLRRRVVIPMSRCHGLHRRIQGKSIFLGAYDLIAQTRAVPTLHYFIIINLKTGHGLPAFFHRLHVVVPFVDPLIGLLPIWGPGKIRRVDICGHPAFKAIHLI